MTMRFYENIDVGFTEDLGTETMTEAEIVEFAERYDPLPKHVDTEAAREGAFSGLIASGLHTLCVANRLVVEKYRLDVAGVAGLGIQDMRMAAPVRPGDELTVTIEVTDKRISHSSHDRGIVFQTITVVNQDGVMVLTYDEAALLLRRGAEETLDL